MIHREEGGTYTGRTHIEGLTRGYKTGGTNIERHTRNDITDIRGSKHCEKHTRKDTNKSIHTEILGGTDTNDKHGRKNYTHKGHARRNTHNIKPQLSLDNPVPLMSV